MAPDKAELVARIAQTRRRPVVATKSQGSAGASVTGPEASANGAGDEIAAIDVFVLRHRLARIRIYAVAAHWDRASVLVRATDRDGRAGWGETYLAPGVVATVRDVAAALIGRRPVARALWAEMRWASSNSWAISALSLAIDDLHARQRGIPLSGLYGGPVRESVPAYASSTGYVEDRPLVDAWLDEADALWAEGFRAFKLRIGRCPPSDELAAIARLRSERPDLEVMADANAAYTFSQALEVGRELGGLGLGWFEEPLPQTGYAEYPRLAAALEIDLAGGELIETRRQAGELLALRAFDIVQPDVSICGGLAEARFIAELAAIEGIRCVPHTCNGAIALAATLQLLSVLPPDTRSPESTEPALEYDAGENPLRTDLLTTRFVVQDGRVAIPDGPGLGVDVDPAALDRYAV